MKRIAHILLRRDFQFWNLENFQQAEEAAKRANELYPDAIPFMPYDLGGNVSPRYGIFQPPVVGEDVSYGFNGDYYPCGKVEKIGKDYGRIKAGGKWYIRRGLSDSFCRRPWRLVLGVHNEKNPSF